MLIRTTTISRTRIVAGAVAAVALTTAVTSCGSQVKSSGSPTTSSGKAQSQAVAKWPAKTITLVVPFKAGGSVDADARALATGLERTLHVSVSVVDDPSGSSAAGLSKVLGSPADGYTYVLESIGYLSNLIANHSVTYSDSAFAPVGMIGGESTVLFAKTGTSWDTLPGMISYAKAHPGTLTVTGTGTVGGLHAAVIGIEKAANIKVTFVPTSGGSSTVPDVLGGHADLGAITPSVLAPDLSNGSVKVLAVASATGNYPKLPGVPTFKSKGYNVVYGSYLGLLARQGTPQGIITKFWDAVQKALKTQAWTSYQQKSGLVMKVLGPSDLRAYMKSSLSQYEHLAS